MSETLLKDLDAQKQIAQNWFEDLRNQICLAFEQIEDALLPDTQAGDLPAGRFMRKSWLREDPEMGEKPAGGGTMAVMRGRVFEKVGVNCSTVFGRFSEKFANDIPGALENDRYFWASGISLVAHPRSPKVPIAHMNTRMIATSKSWFGGGGDLTPIFPISQDTKDFHQAFQAVCDQHDPTYFPKFHKWCDEYFYLPHRKEIRGVGGIFYDYLNEKGWENDFAFTKSVGLAFKDIYCDIVRRHMNEAWNDQDRHSQALKRGRYVEFNLIHDRGTKFGLMTGGNTEAILVSMPPIAAWD